MSAESTKLIEGFCFEVQSNNFKVMADVSEKLGGKNTAPSPHDYLGVALASCTAITVQMYAKRKNFPLDYTDVKISFLKEGVENEILREIKFVGTLSEEQTKTLLMIADKCPIHKLIEKGAKITSVLK
jgi:putative redox protein